MPDQSQPPAEAPGAPGADAPGSQPSAVQSVRLIAAVSSLVSGATPELFTNHASGRRYIAEWLKPRLEFVTDFRETTVYRRYGHELWRIHHEALPALMKTFLPKDLQQKVSCRHHRKKQGGSDPLTLLSIARNGGGNGDQVKRFEAMRDLALGYYFLWLVTEAEYRSAMSRQYWKEHVKTRGDRARFLEYLRGAGVVVGEARRVALHTTHEPEPPYRCVGITCRDDTAETVFVETPSGEVCTHMVPGQELVTLATPDGSLPALYIVRRKGVIQTIAKMLLLGIANPRNVPDRRGIRFAYRSLDELKRGSAWISERVGLAIGRKAHVVEGDPEVNPYAAPNLIVLKDSATYLDLEIEIQNFLAVQHVDLLRSFGPENSLRYHRRQYTDPKGIFPQLYPPDHYGVDWQDDMVQHEMDRRIIASIPK